MYKTRDPPFKMIASALLGAYRGRPCCYMGAKGLALIEW